MTDYKALVADVRRGLLPGDEEMFEWRLADAVESLMAEKSNVTANLTRALDIAQEANDDCRTAIRLLRRQRDAAESERDEAVRQLGEVRQAFGDMEARVVELEALLKSAREVAAQRSAGRLDVDRVLASAPSELLAEHDKAVAAEERKAWAGWIETCTATVPPPGAARFTTETIVSALRSDRRPFGTQAGDKS